MRGRGRGVTTPGGLQDDIAYQWLAPTIRRVQVRWWIGTPIGAKAHGNVIAIAPRCGASSRNPEPGDVRLAFETGYAAALQDIEPLEAPEDRIPDGAWTIALRRKINERTSLVR
jgi:hypothetical protein